MRRLYCSGPTSCYERIYDSLSVAADERVEGMAKHAEVVGAAMAGSSLCCTCIPSHGGRLQDGAGIVQGDEPGPNVGNGFTGTSQSWLGFGLPRAAVMRGR